jgi:RNA polymerase sigma factor (sigma-70 family)
MPARPVTLLRHLRRLVSHQPLAPDADAVLLERFVRHREEEAFTTLVDRHGPLVLRVCRRVLADEATAEDAFQATFLVLARRAAAIRPPEALAAWLYGVARRVALKARSAQARRRSREVALPDLVPADARPDPLSELSARELLAVVDEEVQRLPTAYRLPVILCCLEGRTREEAARLLGWSDGSVKGRLERGRARLHARLARRGLTLTAALAGVEVARGSAGAGMPAALVPATAQAGLRFVARQGASPERAAPLAEAVLRRMAWTRGAALAGLLAAVLAVAGAGTLLHAALGDRPAAAPDPAAAPTDPAPQPRADAQGDALPEGVIARLGTVRLRGVRGSLVYAPDGKLLASATGSAGEAVTLWDPATGKPIRQFPGVATLTRLAFAPDGKRLVRSDNSSHCQVLDLTSGKELFAVAGSHGQFSGDGKVLVTADIYGATPRVHVWDPATGQPLHQWPVHKGVEELALAAAGPTLALVDQADPTRVEIRDRTTGEVHQSIHVAAEGKLWLALSPDGKTLATGPGRGSVRLWDVDTGKEIRSWAQRADSRPVFSADGKHLAWVGYDERVGIGRVWLVERDGATLRAVGTPVNHFEGPCFSPDGKVLAVVTDAGAIALRAAADGKDVLRLDAHDSPVLRLAFTPDGSRLVSGSRTGIFAWEAGTGKLLHRLAGFEETREFVVALLPDGRLFTADRTNDPRQGFFRLLDPCTGREISRIEGRPDVGPPIAVVAPGGRYAALHGRDGAACVFDLATGQCRYRHNPRVAHFGLNLSADGDVQVWYDSPTTGGTLHVLRRSTGKTLTIRDLPEDDRLPQWLASSSCVSPDGRWLIVPSAEGRLRRWDLLTGAEASPLPDSLRTVWELHWSPDGRLIGARGSGSPPNVIDEEARRDERFWNVATGKRVAYLDQPSPPECVHFTPDGRTLVTTDMDGIVHVWETITGNERCRLRGHLPGIVSVAAFRPDARVLASGGYDSQVLVWDLTGRMPNGVWRTARHQPEELRAAWEALAGSDGRAAYAALWLLVSDPDGATALLRDRLRPMARPEPGQVARLIAALDADDFTERRRAGRELATLAELAVPALRQVLARGPSAEARRQLEALVDGLGGPPTEERLQGLRAVEVLEQIGSPEARAVLETLSGGAPEARLTQEAKASLERLAGR